jgi:hypothetical protein
MGSEAGWRTDCDELDEAEGSGIGEKYLVEILPGSAILHCKKRREQLAVKKT